MKAGKSIWGTESRTVSNQELKTLMESYKERNRESVRSALEEKKADTGMRGKTPRPQRLNRLKKLPDKIVKTESISNHFGQPAGKPEPQAAFFFTKNFGGRQRNSQAAAGREKRVSGNLPPDAIRNLN